MRIPRSGFWKTPGIPEYTGIPGYPGIPQEPDDNMQKSDPVGKLAKKSYGTTRLCTLCLLYSHPFCKSSSEVCKKKFMLQIFAKKLFGCHFSWVITKKVIWCKNLQKKKGSGTTTFHKWDLVWLFAKTSQKKASFFWPLPKANWSWHFFNQEKNVQIVDRLLKLILKLSIFGAGKVFLLGGLPFVRLTFLHLTYKNLQKENKPVWLLAKILYGCPFANPQCAKKWSHTTIFKNLVWLLFLHLSSAYQLLEYQACKDWRRLTLWTNIHPSAADSSSL